MCVVCACEGCMCVDFFIIFVAFETLQKATFPLICFIFRESDAYSTLKNKKIHFGFMDEFYCPLVTKMFRPPVWTSSGW